MLTSATSALMKLLHRQKITVRVGVSSFEYRIESGTGKSDNEKLRVGDRREPVPVLHSGEAVAGIALSRTHGAAFNACNGAKPGCAAIPQSSRIPAVAANRRPATQSKNRYQASLIT